MCILKLFCILSLSFCVNGFTQHTKDICNQNPRFICKDIRAALKCDKLLYCLTGLSYKNNNNIVTSPQKKYLTCSECHYAMNMFSEKFENLHFNEFTENLYSLCGKTTPLSKICRNVIAEYKDDLYSSIKYNLRYYSICDNSDFCDENQEVAVVDSYDGDDVECELCQQFAKQFVDLVISSKTEEEFKEILEKVCAATKGFKTECLDIVKKYYDTIYKGLAKHLEPKKVCHFLGMCPASNELDEGIAEVYIMYREEKVQDITSDNLVGTIAGETMIPEGLIKYGSLCSICKYFLRFIQESISLPVNEKLLYNILKAACINFPKGFQQECYNFINSEYFHAFIALAIQEIDPRLICPLINLCPKKSENIAIPFFYHNSNMYATSKDGPMCPLCIAATKEVQGIITGDIIKETFDKVLSTVCYSVHHNLQGHCIKIITHYHEKVYELLRIFTAQEVCNVFSLCSENEFDIKSVKIQILKDYSYEDWNQYDSSLGDQKECDACIAFMKRIEKDLATKDIKERINEFVRSVCSMFPEIKDVCLQYEQEIVETILDFIQTKMTPELVCKVVDLCPSKFEENEERNNESNPVFCALCSVFINGIKKDFSDRKKQRVASTSPKTRTSFKIWCFLGNTRSDNYKYIIANLSKNYIALAVKISLIIHFLHSYPDFCPQNLGAESDEQGERFHQVLKTMEKGYQGYWEQHIVGDYCWSLLREIYPKYYNRRSLNVYFNHFSNKK